MLSNMTDSPHYGRLWQYTSDSVSLNLEVCAVCSKGQNTGEVYGCLEWGHVFGLDHGSILQSTKVVSHKRYVESILWGDYNVVEYYKQDPKTGQWYHLGGNGLKRHDFSKISKQPSNHMIPFLNQYFP